MKNKKLSKQRSCIGCMKKGDQSNFWRIMYDGKNILLDNNKQKIEGRGCYLCPNTECLAKAIKRNAFNYRLKQKIPREEVARFENELKNKVGTGF